MSDLAREREARRMARLAALGGMLAARREIPFDLQLFSTAYDTVVLADAPLHYHRLDETSGTSAADLGSLAVAGTYVGTATTDYSLNWTPGPIVAETQGGYQGKATNASHGVSVTAASTATTAWSIEGWFYLDALPTAGNFQTLWGASGSRRLLINSSGNLYYQGPQGNSTTATALSAGAWHHVVVTSDNSLGSFGQAKFYIDGSADATVQSYTGTSARDWNVAWYVGQYDTGTFYKLVGKAARVAIYATALTSTRVSAHYTQGIAAAAAVPSIVSYAGVPNQATATFHATSGTVSLPHAPTAGNLILVMYAYSLGTGAAAAVPTPATFVGVNTVQTRIAAYQKSPCVGTDQTITLNFGGSTGTFCSVAVWEVKDYNAAAPIPTSSSNSISTASTTLTTQSITPAANSLPFAIFENGNFAFTSGSLTNSWTQDAIQPQTNIAILAGHGPATTGAAISESATIGTANNYQTIILAVAPAAATISASPTSLTFAKGGANPQTSTIASGTGTYSIKTAPNAAVATAAISGSTLTVTPVGQGSTTVVVQDTNNATVTVSAVVDAAMTATPASQLAPYNSGALFVTASKTGYNGALSATSSNTAIATVSGGGNGPTQAFQIVRQTGAGGTCNVTISAADGDSVVVPITYEGPLTVNSVSSPYQGSITVNVSESSYAGVISARVSSGSATLNVTSGQPGTAGGTVPFILTWPANASGQATIVFSDDHGGSLPITLNATGPLVVSATALSFSAPQVMYATTLSATEAADPNLITATSSDPTIATATTTTNQPGSAAWTITPVGVGSCTITVSDGQGTTQTVAVTVQNLMTFAPVAPAFFDPVSAPISFTISNGVAPFTVAVSPSTVATATLDFALAHTGTITPAGGGSATLTVTDAQGQTITVPITVGAALSLSPNTFTFIGAGGTAGLAVVGGRGAFTLTSANTLVATVTGSGPYLVSAIGLGTTTITATDQDGETATASVTVQPAPIDPMPSAATNLRITIFDAKFQSVIAINVGGEVVAAKYEDTPAGCGAAEINTTLTWEQVYQRGYYLGRNGVEISTLDDYVRQPLAANATKIYVGDTRPYDTAVHPEAPQIAIDDGIHFTARIPVTGVGQDATGPYITVGAPLAGGGNPATIPAYGSGALIFRRRWAGRIAQRHRVNSQAAKATISIIGMGARVSERSITMALNTVDVGAGIYQALIGGNGSTQAYQTSLFPDLNVVAGNFPATGFTYSGKRQDVPCSAMITEMLGVIAGDAWAFRVGHDRTPRLVHTYVAATGKYTRNVALAQRSPYYAPASVTQTDQDTSQLANVIKVSGDTNPTTNQPAAGIVGDQASINAYYQVDGAPASVSGVGTDAAAAAFAQGLVNQRSAPIATSQFHLECRSDSSLATAYSPVGLQTADAVDALDCVTITGFTSDRRVRNLIEDSNLAVASLTWRTANYGGAYRWSPGGGRGAFGTSSWNLTETTGSNQTGNTWAISQPSYAPPGAQLTVSATFALANAGSPGGLTGCSLWVYDPTMTTSYGSIAGTFGGTTRPSLTFSLPAGKSAFVVAVVYTGTLVANGVVDVSAFDVRVGPNASYEDNVSAPDIFGLPTSVQTTVIAGGDRFQEVAFAPIVPDWNAQMAELANGIATQIKNNSQPQVQIDSYCLSTDALGYDYSPTSFVLSIPQCLAIFAPNSPIQTVPAQSITLPPNATTWVWLQPTLSWLQQTSYASMPGMILLGYFTSSATGIIGDFAKAPVGVVKVGTGNLPPPGALATPLLGVVSVANGATSSQTSGDVNAQVEVTNVPQDQSVSNLAFYSRETGSGAPWALSGEENISGVPYPAADQNVTHQYTGMPYGKSYDLAVAFEGVSGYGPVQQFQAAFATPPTGQGTVAGGSGGPTISAATFSAYTVPRSALTRGTVSFTETDFGAPPVNLRAIHIASRMNGDAAANPRGMDVSLDPRIGSISGGTATYAHSVTLPAGGGVDIGVYYEFTNGNHSPTTWPAALSNIADPAGDLFDGGDTGLGGLRWQRGGVAARAVVSQSADAKGSYLQHGILYAGHALPQGSMLPITSSFNITCTPTNPSVGSPYIAYAWTAWDLQIADGTLDPGNGGSTYGSFSGPNTTVDYLGAAIAASTPYFVTAAYNWNTNGNVTTWFSAGHISLTMATSFMGDGKYTLQVNKGPFTIPATAGTTGTSYNPPPPQCPAAWQPMETLEHGIIPAGRVRPGMHVRGFGQCWARVTRNSIRRLEGVRVVIDGRPYDVDANHGFLTRVGWWPAQFLRAGDEVVNNDPRRPSLRVGSVRRLGAIDVAGIEVVGHMLRLDTDDGAVSHNLTYSTY